MIVSLTPIACLLVAFKSYTYFTTDSHLMILQSAVVLSSVFVILLRNLEGIHLGFLAHCVYCNF